MGFSGLIEEKVDLKSTSYLYFILLVFMRKTFWAYKEESSFFITDGKFLGWEDFFPRVNKEIHY